MNGLNQYQPPQRPNNRRPNNRRPNAAPYPGLNRYPPEQTPSPSDGSQSGSGFGTMMLVLVVGAFIAFLLYAIYTYGSDLYTKFSDSNFYILNWDSISEEEKSAVKCKKGCDKGKCVKGDGTECESDADCTLCADNNGGFYGTVPASSTTTSGSGSGSDLEKRLKALEEDEAAKRRKIEDLEKIIERRNEEVDKLNRYIDYVNKTRTSGTLSKQES